MRTWKSKNNILNSIQDTIQQFPETDIKDSTKAIFPLMIIINSEILANALCKNNFYIELIINDTERDFLTCDFPVIYLQANYKEKTNINDLIIYYPLTPRLTIKCTNTINSNIEKTISNSEIVDEYNNKIINAAEKQIYSKTKEELEFYLANGGETDLKGTNCII